MILNEGEATFKRKDYKFDKLVDVVGMATRLAGTQAIASGMSQKAAAAGYNKGFDYARSIYE